MDLKALAKLVSSKVERSADLDALLSQYGVTLSFREKVKLIELLPDDISVVYDAVTDRFIVYKNLARSAHSV